MEFVAERECASQYIERHFAGGGISADPSKKSSGPPRYDDRCLCHEHDLPDFVPDLPCAPWLDAFSRGRRCQGAVFADSGDTYSTRGGGTPDGGMGAVPGAPRAIHAPSCGHPLALPHLDVCERYRGSCLPDVVPSLEASAPGKQSSRPDCDTTSRPSLAGCHNFETDTGGYGLRLRFRGVCYDVKW